MPRERREQQGFLLVETLVVMAILGISLLGILSQSSSLIRGTRIADQGSVATSLAQAKIEELRRMRFVDVASSADASSLAADGTSGGIFDRGWQVTPRVVNGVPAKQVTVSVGWREGGARSTVALTTLVVDIPSYSPSYRTVVERSWRRG